MFTVFNKLTAGLKLVALMAVAVFLTGCAGATIGGGDTVAEPTTTTGASSGTSTSYASSDDVDGWIVARGDNLWSIAGEYEVYNVPEQWPLIYKFNLDQIDDADLIFPGQNLFIPRNSTPGEIDRAIRHARSRGAWAIGAIEASDDAYLESD